MAEVINAKVVFAPASDPRTEKAVALASAFALSADLNEADSGEVLAALGAITASVWFSTTEEQFAVVLGQLRVTALANRAEWKIKLAEQEGGKAS